MGTNMQRQAVPLIKPEAPLVWTWLEWDIADGSYAVIKAEDEWEVIYVDWSRIKVRPFLTDEIEYISPEMDEKYIIADRQS